MTFSLRSGPRASFIDLLFRDNLSVYYEDTLHPVDFPVLVELNNGFNIGMLLFGLELRVTRGLGSCGVLGCASEHQKPEE